MAPSVQRRKVWLTPTTIECRAVTLPRREPVEIARVPQTTGSISAASEPKFAILTWGTWGHVEEVFLLSKFFPIVGTYLSCEDIARQTCATVPKWRIFGDVWGPAFTASRTHHASDLHLKFCLPHQWKYGRHPVCDG